MIYLLISYPSPMIRTGGRGSRDLERCEAGAGFQELRQRHATNGRSCRHVNTRVFVGIDG